MTYIFRNLEDQFKKALERGKSIMLLGPRQTGKTTFLRRIPSSEFISLAPAKTRLRYEKDPSLLSKEVEALAQKNASKPLFIVDEIQKVPELLDEVQDLIDRDIAQFILSGSSARKLRKAKSNWLPGRILLFHMDALSLSELPESAKNLEQLLLYGSLPQVITTLNNSDKNRELVSYVTTYLEEEIRAEAAVRQVANFSRFLELAACESGQITNFSKMASDIGISRNTIASYFQILEDCLIAERVEPLTRSLTRHKLTKTPRYLLFDLGVRRVAAHEGVLLPKIQMGHLFEQWVGLELLRRCREQEEPTGLLFWRDPTSVEVDWVIETPTSLIPIEVKLTDSPNKSDCTGLNKFLEEYSEASVGYVVCQSPHRLKLTDKITAIPWQELNQLKLA